MAPLEVGTEIESDISFNPNTSALNDNDVFELRRLSDLARKNPAMQIEINVYQHNYLEDSVQSSPDLTELIIDSVYVEKQIPIVVEGIVELAPTGVKDSLKVDEETQEELDSLYNQALQGVPEQEQDSIQYEPLES